MTTLLDLWSRFTSFVWNSRGLLLVGLSAVSFSLMSLCADLATLLGTPSLLIVASRGICMAVFSFVVILLNKNSFSAYGSYSYLMLRGFFGTCSIACFFASLGGLQLADASVILFSAPVSTTLIACVVLHERFAILECIVLLLSMAGVFFIARPPMLFGEDASPPPLLFVLLALAASIFSACAYVTIRKLRSVPYTVVVFYFGCVSTVAALLLVLILDMDDIPYQHSTRMLWYLLGTGIAGFIGQTLLSKGLQTEKAGHASVMRNLDLPCAFVWQTTIIGDNPDYLSVAGGVLILTSAILLLLNKYVDMRLVVSFPADDRLVLEDSSMVHKVSFCDNDLRKDEDDAESEASQINNNDEGLLNEESRLLPEA